MQEFKPMDNNGDYINPANSNDGIVALVSDGSG
jgi:hypothetical protein